MEFEIMFKTAYDILKKEGFEGIYLARETDSMIVFYGGDPDIRFYGLRTVFVDKKTGEGGWFDINHRRDEMTGSKNVEIPKEYKFKKSS